MKDYFKQFKLVEVQQTFYKLPKLETALKWRGTAPSDFEFTLKASQLITHPAASLTYRRAEHPFNNVNMCNDALTFINLLEAT